MAETSSPDVDKAARPGRAERLALETGITREQARMLIDTLGSDRASLIREARILSRASATRDVKKRIAQ